MPWETVALAHGSQDTTSFSRGCIRGGGMRGPVVSLSSPPPASVLCLGEWVQMNAVVWHGATKHYTEGNNLSPNGCVTLCKSPDLLRPWSSTYEMRGCHNRGAPKPLTWLSPSSSRLPAAQAQVGYCTRGNWTECDFVELEKGRLRP